MSQTTVHVDFLNNGHRFAAREWIIEVSWDKEPTRSEVDKETVIERKKQG